MMKIGYLGPKGSFTYSAATRYFKQGTFLSYDSLIDLIEAQLEKEITYAMVPIENTIEGSVLPTLDHVYETLPSIQGEIVLPIRQQLMVHPTQQANWRNITKICSHPQALAQSQLFLRANFPKVEIEQVGSTAQGARQVATHPEECLDAIGSKEAANEFGLTIVQSDIQSIATNETRFWVLSAAPVDAKLQKNSHKATFFVDLPENKPGALYQVLSVFANNQVNLTKIESRPQKTRLGEYFFVIDVAIDDKIDKVNELMEVLKEQGYPTHLVGCYPVYHIDE